MTTRVAWLDGGAHTTFTFTFHATPCHIFRFDKVAASSAERPSKRRRPLWDVDGSTALGKKKRRLRLNLITSKLAKPFSSPASHVADHGMGNVTVFKGAKDITGESGRSDMRKIAVMNCVKRRIDNMTAGTERARALILAPQPPLQMEPSTPTHSQIMCQMALKDVAAVKPRMPETLPALPPSPLGQSNYDALDLEDEEEFSAIYGSDEDDDHGSSATGRFSVGTPTTSIEGENYDFLDEIDGIAHDGFDASYELGERPWWG